MDVNYINPFINASMDVFSHFAGLRSMAGTPGARTRPLADKDINGFIGLNGHGISGYFIISFYALFLRKIMARLFEPQAEALPEADLCDLAGELTNMITGAAKADLSQKGYFFDVDVPKISRSAPSVPHDLEGTPVIVVPFITPVGKFHIQASIQRIEEDFQKDTLPRVAAPKGSVSVEEFAKRTGIHPVKVRRLLKTGYFTGKKISNKQWHIPEQELLKIHGYRAPKPLEAEPVSRCLMDETISVEEFSRLSGLSPAKVKSFLRTGFLKGMQDESRTWRIRRGQVSKFIKPASRTSGLTV